MALARRLLLIGLGLGMGLWLVPRMYPWWLRLVDLDSVHHHTGPTLEQLLPLSSLVTLRVQVSDVLETRIHGLTGGISAAVLVKGDVELSTDLAKARFEAVDEGSRTAVLILPQPVASQARLDFTRTRIFALSRDGLWELALSDYAGKSVVNQAYEEAQKSVAVAAEGEALREKAKAQAEQVLAAFFQAMNWRVTVRWGDGP